MLFDSWHCCDNCFRRSSETNEANLSWTSHFKMRLSLLLELSLNKLVVIMILGHVDFQCSVSHFTWQFFHFSYSVNISSFGTFLLIYAVLLLLTWISDYSWFGWNLLSSTFDSLVFLVAYAHFCLILSSFLSLLFLLNNSISYSPCSHIVTYCTSIATYRTLIST